MVGYHSIHGEIKSRRKSKFRVAIIRCRILCLPVGCPSYFSVGATARSRLWPVE